MSIASVLPLPNFVAWFGDFHPETKEPVIFADEESSYFFIIETSVDDYICSMDPSSPFLQKVSDEDNFLGYTQRGASLLNPQVMEFLETWKNRQKK